MSHKHQIPESGWRKYTTTYSALSAAALVNDLELFSLAAKEVVEAICIKHSTAFSGGLISAFTISIGISGNLTKYAAAFNVLQAVGASTFQMSAVTSGPESFSSSTSIRIAAVSVTGLLNAATAGSVDVYAKVGLLP